MNLLAILSTYNSSDEPSPHRKMVLIFHDESIFHSNDAQGWMWGELTDAEYEQGKEMYPDLQQHACRLLKYGAEFEGYWHSEKFLVQVEAAIKIAKVKYASDQYNVLWFFDHSSGHTAFAEDALNASHMNVRSGGKQPVMCDTVYNGKLQKWSWLMELQKV